MSIESNSSHANYSETTKITTHVSLHSNIMLRECGGKNAVRTWKRQAQAAMKNGSGRRLKALRGHTASENLNNSTAQKKDSRLFE